MMVLFVVRIFFLLAVMAVTLSYAYQSAVVERGPGYVTWYIILPALAALGIILGDLFWKRKRLQVLSGLFFGVLAGLAIAYLMTLIVDMVVNVFPDLRDRSAVELVKVLVGVAAVFLCVSFVLQTKDDFRFVIPYVEFKREQKGPRALLLDTSAIIDGRIAAICRTGFIETPIYIPDFILEELHTIADSADRLKRVRGRRGLELVNQLQRTRSIDISIYENSDPADGPVDAKLVHLARELEAHICTTDFNLNKVAQAQGIAVLNINDLANALKPSVIPGETLSVRLVRRGEETKQGVGFLDDGTMVVVEDGESRIGNDVNVEIVRVLQKSSGRLIFGKPA